MSRNTIIVLSILLLHSCIDAPADGDHQAPDSAGTLNKFSLKTENETGVSFINNVQDQEDFNILTYRNFYNGGGVAIGDLNNDGLSDLYFTSNLEENRLYLNKGNFQFEDITESAGVAGTKTWSTGVTMVDINADGYLDIYVANSGDVEGDNKANELFINNGDGTFTESAQEYGLDNSGYSTQAIFFDFDLDGDLDCYLLNNSFKDPSKIELFTSMRDHVDDLGGDKLYRNEGSGKFIDVTVEAGIYSSEIGFGLGAVVGDINNDFYPDIYISNDFWERDYLYINQGDGTFKEDLIERIDFCSISSMGGDIADINNDGHLDIISTDMLAGDNYRLKAMSTFDPYHLENIKYRANYHYQIGQNCLHLNDGSGDFQEIAMLSGVAATDWSWGALFFDFNNDGWKDLFVSNGLQKDLMYMDFRDFLDENQIHRKMAENQPLDFASMIGQMPSSPLANFAYINSGNLQFKDKAEDLGLATPSFSNGSAYGDLDNDGDLDLVINNVNMPAFIYENNATELPNHYLKVKFEGPETNPYGIGATVKVISGGQEQIMQNFTARGFQSSVEPYLSFGIGRHTSITEIKIVWPNLKQQTLTNINADQVITVRYGDADEMAEPIQQTETVYTDVTTEVIRGDATHVENLYNDFNHEVLLTGMLSTETPRLVVGDVNGDGIEDLVMLGSHEDPDKLLLQTADGRFQRKELDAFEQTKAYESTCGAFLDFDSDGDLDLMLGSGGNEYQRGNQYFILRYFENDGKGNFTADIEQNIPRVIGNFSTLEVVDIDKDGDQDMFLGGRAVPGNYGLPARSFLLYNDNGTWREDTPESLAGVGMVTDASWTDLDGDQDADLVVVGDWMGIHTYINDGGKLTVHRALLDTKGWWKRIEPADLDGDGDMDFVVGNWGLNSKFQASTERPLTMHVNDFDENGKSEFIINWYAPLDDQPYPFATKMEITKQLPGLRKQVLKYEDYAQQTYESLFDPALRQTSYDYETEMLESIILWNTEDGLQVETLPLEAQVAPVFGIAVEDFTGDGNQDIWLGGNFFGLKPQVGRMHANKGVLLQGSGNRSFRAIPHLESGLKVEGEVRDAIVLSTENGKVLFVAKNNDQLTAFRKQNASL